MSSKGIKIDCPPFIYNIDFILRNYDIFDSGSEQKMIRFRMIPGVCLDINDDEYIDQINCSKPMIKNCMFSLTDDQVRKELHATIIAYKIKCSNSTEMTNIGCYRIQNLHCAFMDLKKEFTENSEKLKNDTDFTKCPQFGPPTEKTISEVAPLMNVDSGTKAGTVYFSLRMTCFGPCKTKKNVSIADGFEGFLSDENEKSTCDDGPDYDEYMAQINGNSLIVRVPKNHPYLVTQVFDPSTDAKKDMLTIRGCDQQIDFQFPNNFQCCLCKQNYGKCNCNSSKLTDYQRKTACSGSSYKNNSALPAIRGNLKYPGRFEDKSVKFDVLDHLEPTDASEKYRVEQPKSRNACSQVDRDNLHRVMEGLCPIQDGISVCKKGYEDDTDVFLFKINKKRTDKKGKKNEIELELRTPRGPVIEIPKLETREIQVNESEFSPIVSVSVDKGKGKVEVKPKAAVGKSIKKK